MAVEQARRVKAATRQRKAHRIGIKTRVDATRVRQHLLVLRRTMSIMGIAQASSVTYKAVWMILHGQETVMPATERKLLAVTPSIGAIWIDSIGARRRLQALAVMGWTVKEVGRRVASRRGDTWTNITRVMNERYVTATLAHEISAVYEDLRTQAPPADVHTRRAKARAERRRWAPPAAWEGVDIDDPDAEPDWASVLCEFVECSRAVKPGRLRCAACAERLEKHGTLDGYRPARKGPELAEDALFVSEHEGWPLHEPDGVALVAERLGVTVAALEACLARHGSPNTQAEQLAGRNTQ
ncbi:hypothetical protein [Nonomuraea bangladeshensis]|uniref:hypothetical protein n=1 Tax=Nonomuraea bangladeshensis TaxID=404385 RepID=UPI0031D7218F